MGRFDSYQDYHELTAGKSFGNRKAVSFNFSRFIETRRLQPLIYSEKKTIV